MPLPPSSLALLKSRMVYLLVPVYPDYSWNQATTWVLLYIRLSHTHTHTYTHTHSCRLVVVPDQVSFTLDSISPFHSVVFAAVYCLCSQKLHGVGFTSLGYENVYIVCRVEMTECALCASLLAAKYQASFSIIITKLTKANFTWPISYEGYTLYIGVLRAFAYK